ncbi:MAG: hypothetical protein O7B26_00745 [Planctomycetota bacterium]|nr:hypothetical protein [Planctomycetota bacterium]
MSKRELMDRIIQINRSARRAFLQQFSEIELDDYLRQLESIGRKAQSCGSAQGD